MCDNKLAWNIFQFPLRNRSTTDGNEEIRFDLVCMFLVYQQFTMQIAVTPSALT